MLGLLAALPAQRRHEPHKPLGYFVYFVVNNEGQRPCGFYLVSKCIKEPLVSEAMALGELRGIPGCLNSLKSLLTGYCIFSQLALELGFCCGYYVGRVSL